MDIKTLKQSIENKQLNIDFIIFKYTDVDFLPFQYLHAIKDVLGIEVEFIDNLDSILIPKNDIFGISIANDTLRVFNVDCFDISDNRLLSENNLIVICKKLSEESNAIFGNNVIDFPKLEQWQIKDYAYSIAEGITENKLDNLINICKNDIFRVNQELNKLKIFTEQERKYVFDKFVDDGIFDDLSDHNIFDFSNAILKKDVKSLASLYKEIEKIDVEPLGLVTTLYNNLKNIIAIQLDSSASPEKLGMPSNRFWAIKKYNCGFYTKEQLIQSFYVVTDIDRKLKSGEITTDLIVDYVVCHMLSF